MNFIITHSEHKNYFLIETSGKTSINDIEKCLLQIFSDSSWKNGMQI
jgi:hypothetical protein